MSFDVTLELKFERTKYFFEMNLNCPSYIDETCRGIYSHDRNLLLDAFSTHISAKNAQLFIMLSLFAKFKRKYTIIGIFLTLLFQLKKTKTNKKTQNSLWNPKFLLWKRKLQNLQVWLRVHSLQNCTSCIRAKTFNLI